MKICFKCNISKDLSSFYTHSQMLDGHLNKCIDCTKADVIQHRLKNINRIREYDRNRPNYSDRLRRNKEYAKTDKGKSVRKIANLNYILKYPYKNKARHAVNNAIRDKRLIKLPCEICGNIKSEGHHDDYSKPLDVKWLCDLHHKARHKELRIRLI